MPLDQDSSASIHSSSYKPGGYPPQRQPGFSPYNAPPPRWTPHGGQLAGIRPRLSAYLIDVGLVGIVIGVAYYILLAIRLSGPVVDDPEQWDNDTLVLACLVLVPVYLLWLFFNEVYLCSKNNGQTIGKKFAKIRIVKENGGSFGYMDAFGRNIVGYWISSLICFLGFFWGLFDPNKQTWHDKMVHTLVVRT
jgi:uncharacterized RDD family membrane protein YckC